MDNRNLQIDTLRGLACVFLVAYHVVGSSTDAGLKVESGLYRDINDILEYVRMPLFTFLSGIVYAYRPFRENFKSFIKGKLRRLIVPMLVVGTSFAVLQSIIPGTQSSTEHWYLLHIRPVAHFWFIEAIFIIFLAMALLESCNLFESKTKSTVVFLLASLLYLSDITYVYFSVSGALYLFPFFLLGMILQRFSIAEVISGKLGLAISSVGITLLLLLWFDILGTQSERSIFALLLGSSVCIGLLSARASSLSLARIGGFSYTIYLYHIFFTAGIRIVMYKLDIHNVDVLFFSALAVGIFGPILVECFFNGTNFTRITMLGKARVNERDLWLTQYFSQKLYLRNS